ncbi:flavin reductase family protein [Saccharothrix sp. S26]|uniref:flavin reductase family protein n=1 Tax=Saccharothrix sp. S26 TaxID=2907215 RepID=UPI001F40E0C9|nr:flavin reductase family protein [Saccharothrix sp. S26]MCE6996473.1 flavin reductase family protein [Saccharothrix sp. S26]
MTATTRESRDRASAVDAGEFRRVFRRHPAGVVVVTVDAERGPAGFTATSLTSVSAEPPVVCFGISAGSSSWPHVRDAASIVVNFLGVHQEDLARRFATHGVDRFAAPTRWRRLADGEPVLDDTAGWLRAEVEALVPVGDHHLVLARVTATDLREATPPLLYHDGRYHSLQDVPSS